MVEVPAPSGESGGGVTAEDTHRTAGGTGGAHARRGARRKEWRGAWNQLSDVRAEDRSDATMAINVRGAAMSSSESAYADPAEPENLRTRD